MVIQYVQYVFEKRKDEEEGEKIDGLLFFFGKKEKGGLFFFKYNVNT